MRKAILLALFAFAAAVQADWEWNVVMHDGRRHVPLDDVVAFYKLDPPHIEGGGFTLTGQGRTIRGKTGTKDILINNVKYILCFDVVSKDGRILISAMDVVKIIDPVMRPGKIRDATAVKTVVLDAGHGGHDSGACGPLGKEKDASLAVVLRAKDLLKENGYNVVLSRGNDVFIPLEKRPSLANKHANAIFVSVHFNKSKQAGANGVETFALAPRGVPSMDEEHLSYSDYKESSGHANDAENIALATAVHSSMLRHLKMFDRGIKRARFLVLRDAKIPAVLVEGGFMNHPYDGRQIDSPAFRESFARAILEGVNRYKSAVAGQMQQFKPSAVVSATDPTTAPELNKTPPPTPTPVGSKTDIMDSINKARGALEVKPSLD